VIRRVSRMAFETIKANGTLKGQQYRVYEWLYLNGPSTAGEVTAALNHNRPRPSGWHRRLSELEAFGVVSRGVEKKCAVTGFTVATWDVTDLLPKPTTAKVNDLRARGAELIRRAGVLNARAHVLLMRAIEMESLPLPKVDEPVRAW